MFNLLSVGIVENECRDSLTEDTDEDTDEATDGAGRFAVLFCRLPTGVCSHLYVYMYMFCSKKM